MYFHFRRNKIRCHETTTIYTFGHSFFNKRLSITEFAWALTIKCIIIQPYPWRRQSYVRWDKHYSRNKIYFWKREYQICWTIYPSIASLLMHRGKYVCMKRYHCPHLGPDYSFAVFKWDSISSWHSWGNLTVTLSHVYCSAPSELYAKDS